MSLETTTASQEEVLERAAIDRSVRYPVMFFFTSGAAWLLVGTILGLLSSLKLIFPELWAECSALSYGRLFPAHMDALIYGWAMQAGLGVMIWLMARLCRVELKGATTLIVLGHVWNAFVTLGLLCILLGGSTSMPWLDFPNFVWPVLGLTYILSTLTLLVMYRSRRAGSTFISQYYLIAAAVWFPWIFFTANILVRQEGGSAVGSAGINGWYMTNLIYFWMAPIALASAYYIIPKIVGRPIYSYQLAKFGFWSLAFLAGWTGFSRYLGGPFPSWMPAVSGAAAIFILLSVLAVGINHYLTIRGRLSYWNFSPSLRFTLFGGIAFTLYASLGALSSFFAAGKLLQFSQFTTGLDSLAIYGFFSMTVFGAIYFIVPRITKCEWPSGGLIDRHFWFSTYGVGTLVFVMLVGGMAQGGAQYQWDLPFINTVVIGKTYIAGYVIAWFLIGVSNLFFFYQLGRMFIGYGRLSEGPTLIHAPEGATSAAEAATLTAERYQ